MNHMTIRCPTYLDEDKYIIFGVDATVKPHILTGINEGDLLDSATYQQLVRDFIEPTIKFDIFPHEMEGKYFGIVRIANNSDRLYMAKMEKCPREKYAIRVGDSWIRKADGKGRMIRRDYDEIYANKSIQRIEDNDITDQERHPCYRTANKFGRPPI